MIAAMTTTPATTVPPIMGATGVEEGVGLGVSVGVGVGVAVASVGVGELSPPVIASVGTTILFPSVSYAKDDTKTIHW
jgi:hypothetical protein